MSKIEAVLFDLDGTLLDSFPDFLASLENINIKSSSKKIDESVVRANVSDGSSKLLKLVFDIDADDVESNDIAVLYPKFHDPVNFVRNNKKPFVQIVNTYRLNAHSKGDDDRSEEEVKKWWEKEPLKYVETKIKEDEMNQAKLSLEKRMLWHIYQ